MASTPKAVWQLPRIDRADRVIGGVASAISRELGVQPIVIRISFVALALVAGWGVLLYVLTWTAFSFLATSRLSPYTPMPKGATSTHRHVAIAMVVLGLMMLFGRWAPEVVRNLTLPIGLILAGGLITWTRSDEMQGTTILVRLFAGLSVAAGGAIALTGVSNLSFLQVATALVIGVAIVAGITVIAVPSVVRMGRALDDERLERIRADERARISAHLHDSVLQTLTLIQRNADNPAQTAALARQQERELRGWLYGPKVEGPDSIHIGQAIEAAASEIEQMHGTKIEVVSVGETNESLQGNLGALIASTAEAMTNAAAHSGSAKIDVFIERSPTSVEVFIRDTGAGFDPAMVAPDRRGIAESIVGRMERAGGTATVMSAPGEGTEVELCLPVSSDLAAATSQPPEADRGAQ